MLDTTKRSLSPRLLSALSLASSFATSCSNEEMRAFVRKALEATPDFVASDDGQRLLLIRGLARRAARDQRPLGRAYREDSRAYDVRGGDYAEYAKAYDDERAEIGGAP